MHVLGSVALSGKSYRIAAIRQNVNVLLCLRRPPYAGFECHRHAIRHIWSYSGASSAGIKDLLHVSSGTGEFMPGGAGGWQEGILEVRRGCFWAEKGGTRKYWAWEGAGTRMASSTISCSRARQPHMSFLDLHQLNSWCGSEKPQRGS